MPLDSSTYALANLRIDGRRWNELRRIHGQMSTQAAADGSSYFEMGNTKIICTVLGPRQQTKATGGGGGGSGRDQSSQAIIEVEIGIAGFSGTDRKKRSRGDKSVVLSREKSRYRLTQKDGALLAACINAATLALIDAGVPMKDYIAACTTGSTASYASDDEEADPLLDLNGTEEQELPFLTLGTSSDDDKVSVLIMESRIQMPRLESMLSVGLDGCKQVRKILDGVVREHGKKLLGSR